MQANLFYAVVVQCDSFCIIKSEKNSFIIYGEEMGESFVKFVANMSEALRL